MKRLLAGLVLLAGAALILTGVDGWARLATDGQHWLTDMRQRYPGGGDALLFMAGVVLVAILFLRLVWLSQDRRDRADTYRRVYGRPAPRQPGRLSLAYAAAVSLPGSLADRAWSKRARPAVRPITDADLDADSLDRWQAAVLDDPLPEPVNVGVRWAPAVVEATWPEPLHPRLTDYATGPLAPQPLPPVREVARYDPTLLSAPTYAHRAAEWLSDMRDGVEVYDEDGHARETIGSLYARNGREVPRTFYDALAGAYRAYQDIVEAVEPVSPAPRHALGRARGTDTQRALWTQDTGSFPIVREMAGAR